ncbi:MAG: hypothetical protein HKN13_07585 [Rhodothermales bacterium]|nr:hypothetical protein [Rhodothermales bacterium]
MKPQSSREYSQVSNFIDDRLLRDRLEPLRNALDAFKWLKSADEYSDNATGKIHRLESYFKEKCVTAEDRLNHLRKNRWFANREKVAAQLKDNTPPGSKIALVNHSEWHGEEIPDRQIVPFCLRDGVEWSAPESQEDAISQFNEVADSDVDYLAFWWPAFWWFQEYPELDRLIYRRSQCLVHNDVLVLFDLGLSK